MPVVAMADDSTVPLHARDGARDSGGGSPIRTTGLRRSPLTGGVNNASQQFDLPSPTVAVRNLVRAPFAVASGSWPWSFGTMVARLPASNMYDWHYNKLRNLP